MQLPPNTTPADADDLAFEIMEPMCAVFRRKLKSVGLKYTPERARILDAVLRWEDDHTSGSGVFQADQLISAMRDQGLSASKATVYRTIKLMSEAGIIQQVLFDGESAHYQVAYGKRSSGLLVNVDSGAVRSVNLPELAAIRDRLCESLGLVAEGHRLVIYARSPQRADEGTSASSPRKKPIRR